MSKMLNFAQQLVNVNRNNVPNAPWAEAAINAVMNGDAKAGEQIANNLMQSMGMNKEQIMQMARQRFNLPF